MLPLGGPCPGGKPFGGNGGTAPPGGRNTGGGPNRFIFRYKLEKSRKKKYRQESHQGGPSLEVGDPCRGAALDHSEGKEVLLQEDPFQGAASFQAEGMAVLLLPQKHTSEIVVCTDHFDLRGPNGGGPPNPIGGTPKGGGGPVRCCGPKPNPPAGGPPVDS